MTLHPVALPAPCFVWQSMGKTPEVRVKQQLAPERNLASFYNLHNRKATFGPVWTVRVWWKSVADNSMRHFSGKSTSAKDKTAFSILFINCLLHWSQQKPNTTAGRLRFSRTHSRSHRFLPNVHCSHRLFCKIILDCYSGHAEAPGQTDASF